MPRPETTKQKLLIWGVLLLISLSVHFFCNIFSPILLPQLEPDQMMFYMAGKAWMNGMVPYVDFIDVKGPLLWLFYGIGYLITPDKTTGVYLLLALSTTITLRYIYKTGRILNLTPQAAILACCLTLFALFNYDTRGGRAEDLMHPFIAASLFYYVEYLTIRRKNQTEDIKSALCKVAWSAGICISAAILTKFNNIVTGCGVIGLMFIWEWKRGALSHFFIHFIPRALGGMGILLIPFCLILAFYQALDDCIQTYFVLNSQSSSFLFTALPQAIIARIITFTLQDTRGLIPITGILLLCIPRLFPEKTSDLRERISLLILLAITWLPNSIYHMAYYLIVCAPFFAFTGIAIAKYIHGINRQITASLIACILIAVVSFNGTWATRCPFRLTQKMTDDMHAIEKELQQVSSPKIIYYGVLLDLGFGLQAGAQPGCPFWCGLNGLWGVCRKEQNKAIISGTPDYIVCMIETTSDIPKHTTDFFNQHGYIKHGCYMLDPKKQNLTILFKKQR